MDLLQVFTISSPGSVNLPHTHLSIRNGELHKEKIINRTTSRSYNLAFKLVNRLRDNWFHLDRIASILVCLLKLYCSASCKPW